MMWGHLIAFAPASIMWIPSFFDDTALKIYIWTMKFAKEAGMLAITAVLTFLMTDAFEAGTESPRTPFIWLLMLFYIEVQAIVAWIIPHY